MTENEVLKKSVESFTRIVDGMVDERNGYIRKIEKHVKELEKDPLGEHEQGIVSGLKSALEIIGPKIEGEYDKGIH